MNLLVVWKFFAACLDANTWDVRVCESYLTCFGTALTHFFFIFGQNSTNICKGWQLSLINAPATVMVCLVNNVASWSESVHASKSALFPPDLLECRLLRTDL